MKIKLAILIILLTTSCTSKKELAYLGNLPETGGPGFFKMEIPDYKLQRRDVLYITVKAMSPDGMITDFLNASRGGAGVNLMQSEPGQYLYGYDVNSDGCIILPVIGAIHVEGNTTEEARNIVQEKTNNVFNNAIVECKLLSFKYTVLGEVKIPGTYINYNNYLTIFEAIGRAGGVGDYGKRDQILILRPAEKGTKTFTLNLQDKNILSSEAYFLLPNDVVIVEPQNNKIFNMNLPVFSFIFTSVTSSITMLILILNFTK
jgi:polysaccharide export outer membrane protein